MNETMKRLTSAYRATFEYPKGMSEPERKALLKHRASLAKKIADTEDMMEMKGNTHE